MSDNVNFGSFCAKLPDLNFIPYDNYPNKIVESNRTTARMGQAFKRNREEQDFSSLTQEEQTPNLNQKVIVQLFSEGLIGHFFVHKELTISNNQTIQIKVKSEDVYFQNIMNINKEVKRIINRIIFPLGKAIEIYSDGKVKVGLHMKGEGEVMIEMTSKESIHFESKENNLIISVDDFIKRMSEVERKNLTLAKDQEIHFKDIPECITIETFFSYLSEKGKPYFKRIDFHYSGELKARKEGKAIAFWSELGPLLIEFTKQDRDV